LKFEPFDSTKAPCHPKNFACRSVRIVETRVQLLRPSPQKTTKTGGALAISIHRRFAQKLIPFFFRASSLRPKKRARWRFLSGVARQSAPLRCTSRSDCCGNEARRPIIVIAYNRQRADNRGRTLSDHRLLITIYHGPALENLEQFGIDVVLERRHGVRASILRGILYALSFAYDRVVSYGFILPERIFAACALAFW